MMRNVFAFFLFFVLIGALVKNADSEDTKKIPIFNAGTGKIEEVGRIVKSDEFRGHNT